MLPGVYLAQKKNGEIYYRASVTYNGKHISLGSYHKEAYANQAYHLACDVVADPSPWTVERYQADCILSFEKWVVLINFRDNKIYFKNPIYLKKRYFLYYIDKESCLKFDAEDLFYYAHHKIMKRGGHLFVSDYGMQVNILSRYGIKNYAVPGRDYIFANGDESDFGYNNIEIVNRYHGVSRIQLKGQPKYQAKIHINGDYLIGRYQTEAEAAIAYNKAALILRNHGFDKNYPQNFIEGVNEIAYASLYQKLRISKKLLAFAEEFTNGNYTHKSSPMLCDQ
ncbi:MAG TPA: hypothetical protein VN258_15070 [Mobilitalea sp.]|nr:hypothetical protein [Mobilitalea sp.]